MSKPAPAFDPFTNVRIANAHYPWAHPVDSFCSCASCHAYRQARILNTVNVFLTSLSMLEWPTPANDMPPPMFGAALDLTVVGKLKKG